MSISEKKMEAKLMLIGISKRIENLLEHQVEQDIPDEDVAELCDAMSMQLDRIARVLREK